MRALICESLTGISGLRVIDTQAEPPLRAGHVKVAVRAAALNFPDLLMLEGKYQHRPDAPYVTGLEGAGEIVAVADDVDRAHIGRRVMCSARGACAAFVVAHLDECFDVPDGWSVEEAAGYPVVAKTAYHALVHRARLKPGDTLLVHGASGGTGHMAVKLGMALGTRVIATGADPAKLAIVKSLGADVVLDSRSADLVEQIKAASGGRGVDVTFDPVGGAVFDASLKASAFGARVLIIGFTADVPNAVRTNYALIKGLSILGVRAGEAARFDPSIAADYRVALPRIARDHDLRPRIAATFPLADATQAFRYLASRQAVGKVVITL